MLHPRRYMLLAAVMLSSVSALAQSQQKPEFFVGYSNLQAEGLQDNFFSTNLFSRRTTFHGGNGEVTLFPFQTFGITGDLSLNRRHKSADVTGGSDSETTDIAYFMGGPSYVFSNVSERLEPFARILLGVAHTRYRAETKRTVATGNLTNSFDVGSTDFAMGIGGGLDLKVNGKFGKFKVRIIQIDYAPIFLSDRSVAVLGQAGVLQPVRLDGQREDNIRFSFGVTF